MFEISICLDHIILRISTLTKLRRAEHHKKNSAILFITKFPPVIGGVATLEYWRAYTLARLGYTVLVVTNCIEDINGFSSQVASKDIVSFLDNSIETGKVKIFYTTKAYMENGLIKRNHQHIPFNDTSTSKLYSIAKSVIEKYNPDVIYSGYLEPYGLVSYLLAEKYKKPYVIGFAGSDFNRLLTIPELNNIYSSVLRNATYVCATWNKAERLINMGVKASKITYVPQPIIFPDKYYCNTNQYRGFSVGIYGKCGRHKRTEMILEAIGSVSGIVVNCITMPANEMHLKCNIKKYCSQSNIVYFEATTPNAMSKFLNCNQIMFFFDEEFDVTDHAPIAPIEAGLCGVCVVFSKNLYSTMIEFGFKENINCIVLKECNTNNITKLLKDLIRNKQKYIKIGCNAATSLKEHVNNYISEYQNIFNYIIMDDPGNNFVDELMMLYLYYKYTIVLMGEQKVLNLYNKLNERLINKDHKMRNIWLLADEIQSKLINDNISLIYQEIIFVEIVKMKLYYEQMKRNKLYLNCLSSEQYTKFYSMTTVTLKSNAIDILRNIRVTEISLCGEHMIYVLCKSTYEIVIFPEYNPYAEFLFNFENLNSEELHQKENYISLAISEGLIFR